MSYKKQHITPEAYLKYFAKENKVQVIQLNNEYRRNIQIKGIGDKIVDALFDMFHSVSPADIVKQPDNLIFPDLNIGNGALGEKRSAAICKEIKEKFAEATLATILGSLPIRGLGKRRAQMMMDAVPELREFPNWNSSYLKKAGQQAGVPKMVELISEGVEVCQPLIQAIAPLLHNEKLEKTVLNDKKGTVCITGKLPSGRKKSDYAQLLANAGYELVDDVKQGLTYLVQADTSSSSKSKKAEKYGVRVISETELMDIVDLCSMKQSFWLVRN